LSQNSEASVTVLEEFEKILEEAQGAIDAALDDDLNTPEVMGKIFEMVRGFNAQVKPHAQASAKILAQCYCFKNFVRNNGKVMSLFQEKPESYLKVLDDMLLQQNDLQRDQIDLLVKQRRQARREKNYAKADELRDQLIELGIELHDAPNGSFWEVKK